MKKEMEWLKLETAKIALLLNLLIKEIALINELKVLELMLDQASNFTKDDKKVLDDVITKQKLILNELENIKKT